MGAVCVERMGWCTEDGREEKVRFEEGKGKKVRLRGKSKVGGLRGG